MDYLKGIPITMFSPLTKENLHKFNIENALMNSTVTHLGGIVGWNAGVKEIVN